MQHPDKEARYQQIAQEIAKRIVAGNLNPGDKLRGRSLLSSEYNVSGETIRKAVRLLQNFGAVEVKERSGIIVLSKEAAGQYIDFYKKQKEDHKFYNDTLQMVNTANKINQNLHKAIRRLFDASKKDVFPFDFFTIEISSTCPFNGNTLESLHFWDATNGLILAIEHDDVLFQAPNPKMIIEETMVFYVLGDDLVKQKTLSFLSNDT